MSTRTKSPINGAFVHGLAWGILLFLTPITGISVLYFLHLGINKIRFSTVDFFTWHDGLQAFTAPVDLLSVVMFGWMSILFIVYLFLLFRVVRAFLGTFVLQNNVWWGYNHD